MDNNHKHVEINIGNACNFRCIFCMSYHRKYNKSGNNSLIGDKNYILKEIITHINKGYNSVGFVGGEPTIFKELLEYIKLSKILGYKQIQITTNGYKLSNFDFFLSLVKSGLNRVKLSIHANSNVESNITQVNDSYKNKIQAIENYLLIQKKYNILLDVQVVINNYNYKYLLQMAISLISKGVNSIRFQYISFFKSYPFENLKKSFVGYYELLPYLKDLVDYTKKNNISKITISDIPICFLIENGIVVSHEDTIIAENIDYFDHVADSRVNNDFSFKKYKLDLHKEYPLDKCKNCKHKYYNPCPGFNIGYTNLDSSFNE